MALRLLFHFHQHNADSALYNVFWLDRGRHGASHQLCSRGLWHNAGALTEFELCEHSLADYITVQWFCNTDGVTSRHGVLETWVLVWRRLETVFWKFWSCSWSWSLELVLILVFFSGNYITILCCDGSYVRHPFTSSSQYKAHTRCCFCQNCTTAESFSCSLSCVMHSFMAITVRTFSGCKANAFLLSFEAFKGSHTGVRIAEEYCHAPDCQELT